MKVTNKLDNASCLLQNKNIAKHIPQTTFLSKQKLKNALTLFPFVYLKPINSAQGKGILRVDKSDANHYLLRSRDHHTQILSEDFSTLYSHIQKEKRKRPYLIQQGINSVTHAGLPFDLRVHLTRVKRKWVIAGMVGRIGKKESIVTNTYSGGASKYVYDILTSHLHLSHEHALRYIYYLAFISLESTKTISKRYPEWNEFGLDIGMDENKKTWIYEINIYPGALVFKNLDKKTYHRILRLRKEAR